MSIATRGRRALPDAAALPSSLPAAIAAWARVLRPGGRAVTATFVAVDPTRHRAAAAPGSHNHVPFDSVDGLAETVAPSGFRLARSASWTDGADELLLVESTYDAGSYPNARTS